jgi:[acyl-carrier-protein] S-malonyltransferase
MQPAAERMASALAEVAIVAPAVPVVANVLAEAISDPQAIRQRLVEQVTGTVRWRESLSYMADEGVRVLYEVGAGRVLTGLVRRIDDRLEGRSIGTAAEIGTVGKALAEAV